ncbi:hypothetical protein [Flavobacterium phage Fpv6]|uniref:hypothetical protein n=2 Tax=root TaxID=1 RepID=UPI00078C4B1E|nr:hypothetical protein BOW77_gp18 [Flavobacterium phage Fpv7]YP_009322289.1 hypothetical protein BOW76_gp18 [Flavobacterium phage Fpv8]YP_009322395.1 hypothetical protein BOW79_gp18 [Flavobacterium phage Fpv5]YP_009323689.1 hypothetical protein BOW72_gp18 [Flavobacterium phage Fpv10]YP_009324541.1 hypothetical protein BOW78_gp18 [Flavobacterium phage Fpv6]YP_009325229.1 hypothetical protein BOW83_gp18 [Flavobacterium phage Fpv11]ALN97206.1 hypothetical protein [Flavobacterium phage FpV9]QCW
MKIKKMKKLILTAIISILIIGCASKKKTSQTDEKTTENKELNVDVKQKEELKVDNEKKSTENESSTKKETVVVYKPKFDSITRKFEPFKMNTKKNGQIQNEIEINGNGEVMIHTTENELNKTIEEKEKSFIALYKDFELLQNEKNEIEKNYKNTIKEKTTSIFNLWIIIIVLSILLALSIYLHITRTKIPFLNK